MHGRKSDLPQGVILPGLLRGVGWALMVLILMFANEMLPLTISYPLSLTVLAVAITGFAFHCGEFPTRRARILAALCTVMRILAVSFMALSGSASQEDVIEQAV
mmetsp:Transcript_67836/g.174840  ORF Transcript_67836/g.174840 Transcript_67836/m.174840 type:complete len:104 (-) Transcript_67836:37-348(-)